MYQIRPLEEQYKQIHYSFLFKNQVLIEERYLNLQKEIDKLFFKKREEINKCNVKIFFIGVQNSGKSTLINSIIGYPVLPTGNERQKHFITLINNQQTMFEILENDAEILIESPLQIRQILSNNTNDEKVRFQFKTQFKIPNTQIIDTPGLSFKDDQQNQNIINKIIGLCDEFTVPIFVMVINKNNEQELLIELLQKIIKEEKNINISKTFESLMTEIESEIQLEQRNTISVISKYDKFRFESRLKQELEFQFQSIFRVSGLYSFYNSVFQNEKTNYYNQVIEEFQYMNQAEFNLQNVNQAVKFIRENILNCHKLDFDLFLNHLFLTMKYEYNRMQLNATHHLLQAKLCNLDLIQQGMNLNAVEDREFKLLITNIIKQQEVSLQGLIQEFGKQQESFTTARRKQYAQFIQVFNLQPQKQLRNTLKTYCTNAEECLKNQVANLKNLYDQFIGQSVDMLRQLLGSPQMSFELISLSNQNIVQHCELIIQKVKETILMDDEIQELELLKSSLVNETMPKELMKEAVHSTERHLVRIIIDKKNSYIFALSQLLQEFKTFAGS